jgi:hypothetical protein
MENIGAGLAKLLNLAFQHCFWSFGCSVSSTLAGIDIVTIESIGTRIYYSLLRTTSIVISSTGQILNKSESNHLQD